MGRDKSGGRHDDSAALNPEQAQIRRLFAPLAGEGALELSDDAAWLHAGGEDLIVTKDMLVAGVHFLQSDPPDLIARKALRVNLSDLAAKGAKPKGYLLGLAAPKDFGGEALSVFVSGLREDQAEFGIHLLGGDTVGTPGPLTLSITAFGTVPEGCMVKRRGAARGDLVYVTGTIGDGALGLLAARNDRDLSNKLDPAALAELAGRYRLPQPRLGLAEALRAHAGAAMDISDGLAGDLALLCHASGVSAEIDCAAIPLSAPARAALEVDAGLLELVLTGGDDYELIVCVDAKAASAFEQAAARADIAVCAIGRVVAGAAPPDFKKPDGNSFQFAQSSFSHL